jgi:hypothetical protein
VLDQKLAAAEAEIEAHEAAQKAIGDDVDKLGAVIKCAHDEAVDDSQS